MEQISIDVLVDIDRKYRREWLNVLLPGVKY